MLEPSRTSKLKLIVAVEVRKSLIRFTQQIVNRNEVKGKKNQLPPGQHGTH